METLIAYAKEKIAKYPQHRAEIIDMVEMAQDEIHDGGSEEHEVELAMDSISEIVGEG